MNNYKNIKTTWKDLPDILEKATSNLNIKISDPWNVIIGDSNLQTLGGIIRYSGSYLFDFSTNDFSEADILSASYSFLDCKNLSGIGKLPNNIVYATDMFTNCVELRYINTDGFINLGYAEYMFAGCTKLESIDTINFTNIKQASRMFYNCTSLKNIDMSGFENIENADEMFFNCKNLSGINPNFGKNLKNLESYNNMFEGCQKIY